MRSQKRWWNASRWWKCQILRWSLSRLGAGIFSIQRDKLEWWLILISPPPPILLVNVRRLCRLMTRSPPGATWQSRCLLEMHCVRDVIRNIDMSSHFLCTTDALVTVWAVNEKISGPCQLSSRPNEAERGLGGGDLIKHTFLFPRIWGLIRMFVKKKRDFFFFFKN